jgi:tetratricopeptide (TPR) repeat protein
VRYSSGVQSLMRDVRRHYVADDWYRSKTWTPDVAVRFEEKLRRAKMKDQYLRIQAASLIENHPEVAISLVQRFFQLDNPFTPAMALEVKAQALAKLGRLEEAVQTFEEVLKAEEDLPNAKTNAFADMAELVVTHGITQHYGRVLAVLEMRKDMLNFPVLGFVYHASRSIIFQWQHRVDEASEEKTVALELAARRSSGLQYHSDLGLVGPKQAPLLKLLQGFRDA